jgi:tetratricopeptide (TPR) repeat protein
VEYGKVKGSFRGRWWNYYERGLSFMEGEFYKEAIADFDQAIKQRSEDKRMARTYGMHFVDYFPHREKGLVYYLTGEYDAAKREIELSHQQQPSAKAQYYLDRIRAVLMKQEGQEVSTPRIMVDLPSYEIWTRDDPVTISGAAEDRQYISYLKLAEKSVFIKAAEQKIGFKEEISLDQGRHIIDITARNLLGGEKRHELVIHVDRQGPVITLEPNPADAAARDIINGFLYDESGGISLSIDGVDVPVSSGEDVRFSAPVKPGAKTITLLAKDRLGNETMAEIELTGLAVVENTLHNYFIRHSGLDKPAPACLKPGESKKIQSFENLWIPRSSRGMTAVVDSPVKPGNDGSGGRSRPESIPDSVRGRNDKTVCFERLRKGLIERYPLLASNRSGDIISDAGNYILALSLFNRDRQGPVIEIKDWTDEQTVFLDRIYIQGKATDDSDIASMTINNTPVPRRSGRQIYFNQLIKLKEGKNVINITAEDEEENRAEKEITVIRQVPKVLQVASRFSMTLIPLNNTDMKTGLSDAYDNLLLAAIMNQDRFRLIEREYLDRILQEQKISRTELADKDTALKVGKLVAAQSTLVGDFTETSNGIEIVTRLFDNETSLVLAAKDVYSESKDRAALQLLAEGIAVQYHLEFPMVDGIIVQEKGDSFYTDLGEGKTKPERRLIIFREGEPILHPVTGKHLGSDTEIIGYARVKQVMEEMSQAELLEGQKDKRIKIKDKVMTQ